MNAGITEVVLGAERKDYIQLKYKKTPPTPRFFEKLEFMANSCETIHKLCSIYKVYFVSIGMTK